MNLLLVESPGKCKTIQGYLGREWRVQATIGHMRHLKEELAAIGFGGPVWSPTYELIPGKADVVARLRESLKGTRAVYLGSDDDREGEAIAWHTCAVLGLDPATTPRIVFHSITESDIRAAVAAPRRIDMNRFFSQQARSMLDLLLGFTLSPCLWRGVGKTGLSAGRCQTPALRLVYDLDQRIAAHTSTASWALTAQTEGGLTWTAACPTEADVLAAVSTFANTTTLTVRDRTERVSVHAPPTPFITSTLQQEASSRLGMNPKATMRAAQALYEAGHITYMRTDNPVLSPEGAQAARTEAARRWGDTAVGTPGTKGSKGKGSKAAAQNAHEAVRPTHMEVDTVDGGEQRLYALIWKRTLQSVMAPEERDVVRLTAVPTGSTAGPLMETTWDKTRLAGWRTPDLKATEETAANAAYDARTALVPGTVLPWSVVTAKEVATAPPAHFSQASLIQELERRDIGRPTTYATLVETVLEREYVEVFTTDAVTVDVRGYQLRAGGPVVPLVFKEKRGGERNRLRTTALGRTVIEWLLAEFGDILEYDFTASMERQLDEVARGSREWPTVLDETWARYAERYKALMTRSTGGESTKVRDLGDGYKVVNSHKGVLFVHEVAGQKTRFAAVTSSFKAATREEAEAAFDATAAVADVLGELDGEPVVRKSGKFGPYVTWRGINLSCKADDTLMTLEEQLRGKIDHTVGPYRIGRNKGLYIYKTGGRGKPVFVTIPDTTDWAALTVESAEALYAAGIKAKKARGPKSRPAKDED